MYEINWLGVTKTFSYQELCKLIEDDSIDEIKVIEGKKVLLQKKLNIPSGCKDIIGVFKTDMEDENGRICTTDRTVSNQYAILYRKFRTSNIRM